MAIATLGPISDAIKNFRRDAEQKSSRLLEIEAPLDAVAVWLRADTLYVRFPGRQLITMPATEIGRLLTTLHHRENAAIEGRTVGTKRAPVQYDIEKIADALKISTEAVNKKGAEIRERVARAEAAQKKRLIRRDDKRMKRKEAEQFLAQIGL